LLESYSSKHEERITKTAESLEANYLALEKILQPFEVILGLPLHQNSEMNIHVDNHFHSDGGGGGESSSYDSATQVITHIVRDWSPLGRKVRMSLYDWCIDQLLKDHNKIKIHYGVRARILVPGAGLGRLAMDIYKAGFTVEANEISIVMSAAAHNFLHRQSEGFLCPFACDFPINEVNSDFRYDKVQYSDESSNDTQNTEKHSQSLSYTVGDFVDIYSSIEKKDQYESVVTCFFIDTASNIYEYIVVIKNALKSGGRWINVGPLQWHQNAILHPAGNELRSIIESMGFDIESWTVDDEVVNYRHDDSSEATRYTKYEGYKPLRFVAKLSSSHQFFNQEEVARETIIRLRKSINQKVKITVK